MRPATSTRATTSSTGAFRPKDCGAWRGIAGFTSVEIVEEVEIDGHPRIIAVLRSDA